MSIEINLAGKTAAITGAGRGLGKAIALTLAKAGASVWVGSRKEDQSKEIVKELQDMGYKAGYSVVDVSKLDEMKRFIDNAEKFGGEKLDIMVNNAGVVETDDFFETSVEQIDKLFDINIVGVSNALQTALPKMIPNKAGKIVIISSFAGQNG